MAAVPGMGCGKAGFAAACVGTLPSVTQASVMKAKYVRMVPPMLRPVNASLSLYIQNVYNSIEIYKSGKGLNMYMDWHYGYGIGFGWGTLSLINAGLAQLQGRSGLIWFLVSLFLGPLATLLLVVTYQKK